MIRTFIALPISLANKSHLSRIIDDLKAMAPERAFRWANPETIHLTIKFLGDIDPDRVSFISDSLKRVAGLHTPFQLRIHGLGCFPNPKQARVLWVGLQDHESGALYAVQQSIEHEFEGLGFAPEDRLFHPHLTLARIKEPVDESRVRTLLDRWNDFGADEEVSELLFMQSKLTPGGPVYTPLCRIGFS